MRLKASTDPADVMAMFSATTQPPALSEACLQCLCASLNAPIVHVDQLPAGPARCAVVVYAEAYGDLGMAVAVRSLEGGEVLVLRAQEPLPPDADPTEALERAISFAEGLGFVFDDDMLAGHPIHETRLAALDHWQKLIGSDEVFSTPDVASPPTPEGAEISPDPERMPAMEDLLSAAAHGGDDEPVEIELDELSLGHLDAGDLEDDALETDGDELLLEEIAPLEPIAPDEPVALAELTDDGAAVELEGDPSDELVEVAGDPPDELNEVAATIRAEGGRRPAAASMAEVTEPIELDAAPSDRAGGPPSGQAFAASPLSKFRRPADAEAGEARDESGAADDAAEAEAGGSALGRVKIVRMRKSRDGRATARGRVLASY